MSKIWKVGARWGTNGPSLLGIFRRSGYIFYGGRYAKNMDEIRPQDYIAIADGKKIVSIAEAMEKPVDINTLIEQNKIKLRDENITINCKEETCFGVRVKIVDLAKSDWIPFGDIKGFCEVNKADVKKRISASFQNNNTSKFDINSSVCRLGSQKKDGKGSIFGSGVVYRIPVYQREYSWGYDEIYRFISDIFKGFWGAEEQKTIVCDPMFIGTMQLSYKKFITEKESEQDVIDGQQRLSTIICFLKFLQLRFPESDRIKSIKLNWLETSVNNGKEDEFLRKMYRMNSLSEIDNVDNRSNKYIANIGNIQECFNEQVNDESGKILPDFENNLDSFLDYLMNEIYVVVVETSAGLSKTIQIFNTINTAGLDLNGTDLFKVRFYEYLHDKKGKGEDAFNEIGEFFRKVKELNIDWRKTHDYDLITMDIVLSIYKYWLISRHCLVNSLYTKSTDTFFNELFDTVLGVQEHSEYKCLNDLDLKIEDLDRIKDVICFWEKSDYRSADEYLSYTLIQRSRYSRYLNVAYLILLSNESTEEATRLDQVYEIQSYLSRVFFCWSLEYSRVVNEISTLMNGKKGIYNLMKDFQANRETILEELTKFLNKKNNDYFKENHIGKSIAGNRTWKDLVCFLSAYLDENNVESASLQQIISHLSLECDIEHIHANANDDEAKGISYDLQNSIGNLMLLEKSINRSIGCIKFSEKKERANGLSYKNSQLRTVQLIKDNAQWELSEIDDRRKKEIKRISEYIFIQ